MANNKALFLTWTKNLYYLQIVALIGTILANLPFIGSWIGWVNILISLGILFVIYKLSPINERYHKTMIFMAIACLVGILVKLEILTVLSLAGSICSLIAQYQEYCGHAEMLTGIDEKLSKNWHTLFNVNIIGSILVAVFGGVIVVIATVLLLLEANITSAITIAVVLGFEVILRLFYLRFLKKTREAYEKYEPAAEEMGTDEI